MKRNLLIVTLFTMSAAFSFGQTKNTRHTNSFAVANRSLNQNFDPYQRYFITLDSLFKLYSQDKLSNIEDAIKQLEKSTDLKIYTTIQQKQPLSITISHNELDEQAEQSFYQCVGQDGLITTLSQLYSQNRLKFTTYEVPGMSGAGYDPDAVPAYGFDNTNTKTLNNYMQLIALMTSYSPARAQLHRDKNDLKSYMAIEKNSKIPVLILRRKFIFFLHQTYHIPYMPVNQN